MYDLLHVLSNDLRLKIQGQGVHHIAPFDMKPRASPKYPVHECNSRPDRNIPPDTHRSAPPSNTPPKVTGPEEWLWSFFFFFVLYCNDAWMTAKVIDSPWNLVISDNEISIITMISTCCQVCYKYDKKIVKYFCCNLISWNYFFWN